GRSRPFPAPRTAGGVLTQPRIPMAVAHPTELAVPLERTAAAFRAGTTPPLQAVVKLNVRTRAGRTEELPFVIDSGAGVTSVPWATAVSRGIPIGTTGMTS